MKLVITAGKLLTLVVWLVLAANLVMPFPGNGALILYILTGLMLVMHGIQLMIFWGAFGKQLKLTGKDKLMILVFGFFSLLDLRERLNSKN